MPAKNEFTLTRVYDAPVKAVWDAWTDDKQAEKWWGPRGWWIKSHSKDLRPGGFWKYTMYGPNGEVFENVTTYHVVENCARLEYDHGGGENRPPLFQVVVTFAEKRGKTHMEMTMRLATPEKAAETKKFVKLANGNSTWDRLAEHLAGDKEKFIMNRTFSAPIAKVYEAWATPEIFSKWLPPTGMTMEFLKADFKVGGRSTFKMTGNNITMYGSLTHREFSPVTRLVYEQDFRDANDKISRHPFAPLWPESMTATITLAEESPTDTRVTVEWVPAASSTAEELAAFRAEKPGMMLGWRGSFEKLADVLQADWF